jgi:excisionase family DNA binding protein
MQSDAFGPQRIAISIREACEATSLGRTTIFNHIRAGRLRAVRVGGRTLIPIAALRALVEGEVEA